MTQVGPLCFGSGGHTRRLLGVARKPRHPALRWIAYLGYVPQLIPAYRNMTPTVRNYSTWTRRERQVVSPNAACGRRLRVA
jgi:hypothetical protein